MVRLIRHGTGTLYHQLLSELIETIRSGGIKVGDKLPTEAELSRDYGVSRTTVRRALDELSRQGLVQREPGRGTFLADPKIHADFPYLRSFTEEIERLGYRPGAELLSRREAEADEDIARRLAVEPGSPVLLVRRLRTADGRAIFVCDSRLPLARFPALRDADYSVNSLYELLEDTAGRKITGAKQWISAAATDRDVAGLLELEVGRPVLQLERVTRVAGDLPIESVEAFFRPDRYRSYSELVPRPIEMSRLAGSREERIRGGVAS